MSATIIMGLIIAAFGGIIFLTFKRNIELKKDLKDEEDRSQQFRAAMHGGVELANKADKIDQVIEEKKRARKKMSKADKIAAANNRTNHP